MSYIKTGFAYYRGNNSKDDLEAVDNFKGHYFMDKSSTKKYVLYAKLSTSLCGVSLF